MALNRTILGIVMDEDIQGDEEGGSLPQGKVNRGIFTIDALGKSRDQRMPSG